MKLDTITKYREFIEEMFEGDYISLKDFCEKNELNYNTVSVQLNAMRNEVGEYKDLCDEAISKYTEVQNKWRNPSENKILAKEQELKFEDEVATSEELNDTDERVTSSILRNNAGKIVGYKFIAYRRDKSPVTGVLTRDEMQIIYRNYSNCGASLTQQQVSRFFPDYSLADFKRILRCFNITKASGPFAPHMYEEHNEEELKEYHLREKENDFLKKIEKDELNDVRRAATDLARENRDLREKLSILNDLSIDLGDWKPSVLPANPVIVPNNSLILHLSDLHIGAKCESNTLYPNEWNERELRRRLEAIIQEISKLGRLNKLIITMLGDNLDGMDNQTARRDHFMPQNMDNREQLRTFLSTITTFIDQCRLLANKVVIYSVPDGNHDGDFGYAASIALKYIVENKFNDVEFILFDTFFGVFEFLGHTYVISHGKDSKFMKRGLPLNLDEKSKVMIYEWLEENNIHGDNIHIVKGDLHSNALNSCKRFDYRNVLSLFGASDYSNYNFSRNSYGVSFDLFVGNCRTIGTFENV